MKILKLTLILAGIALIALGVYNAFAPQEILAVKDIAIKEETGFNNQTIGMIGLGVVAIIAGTFLKNRR